MLRVLFVILLTSCCQSKLYQAPVFNYPTVSIQGTVAILDPDPLCHLRKGKGSEELLEDILTYQILKQWVDYNHIKVPYEVVEQQKPHTVVRCKK